MQYLSVLYFCYMLPPCNLMHYYYKKINQIAVVFIKCRKLHPVKKSDKYYGLKCIGFPKIRHLLIDTILSKLSIKN